MARSRPILLAVLGVLALTRVEANLFVTTGMPNQLDQGITCSKETDAATLVDLDLNVFEPDFGFRDDNGEILHFTCQAINRADLPTIVFATETNCGNSNRTFMTVNEQSMTTVGPIDNNQQRTHYMTLNGIDPAGTVPCGGVNNAGTLQFATFCYLEQGFNHEQDRAILFDVLVSDCLSTQQDADNVDVENPSNTNLDRRYSVTCKLYNTDTRDLSTLNSNTPVSAAADEVNAPVALGDELYAECCIDIGTGDSRSYFIDGVSVLGLTLRNCKARIDPTQAANYLGTIDPVDVVDGSGCGKGVSPFAAWTTNSYQFQYARGSADGTSMLWLQPPNCFRSTVFEAVSFARSNIRANSELILDCDIKYCVWSNDTDCFGEVTGDPGDTGNYNNVCPATARKRREADESIVPENLPTATSFKYSVINNYIVTEDDNAQTSVRNTDCFSRPTFIGLSSGLAALLAIVLLLDGCLAIRLMSRSSKRSDSSSGSVASSKAFSNKGFY